MSMTDESMTTDGTDPLVRAAAALRLHTDEGWVAVRQRVVDAALAAVRPARTVAGEHDHGRFTVSTDVLTDLLREAMEPLPDAAPTRVVFETDDDDRLVEVRVSVVVAFGCDVVETADEVRRTARGVLLGVLVGVPGEGVAAGDSDGGGLVVDVHVGDVTEDRRRL